MFVLILSCTPNNTRSLAVDENGYNHLTVNTWTLFLADLFRKNTFEIKTEPHANRFLPISDSAVVPHKGCSCENHGSKSVDIV
jgi:hypothetical protein